MADDFENWRRFVSTTLQNAPGLHIVGEASDGLEAVKKAQELKPDLILLDIGLPRLNGIEAARQIRKVAPNSMILFVSAEDSLDIAAEALNTGASGYVVKSDAGSELLAAMEAVIQGKRFVSSRLKGRISVDLNVTQASDHLHRNEILASPGPTLPQETSITRRHEVQFYSDDAGFLERVTHFIAAALKDGNPVIVFATESHRNGLLERLKAQGIDVDSCIRNGTYISLDAADTLSMFMVDDWPDPVRFHKAFRGLLEAVSKKAKAAPRVAIFGEWAGLLWAKGKRDAAIRLEQLGNELTKMQDVDILCAYPFSGFHREELKQAFETICVEHSAVYVG